MNITVGMASHKDFHGTYFTVQALRMYHTLSVRGGLEIVVVDSSPDGSPDTKKLCSDANTKYIHAPECTGTAAPRARVFKEATNPVVVCLDCHVLMAPAALLQIALYFDKHPDSKDLVQGPMLSDNLVDVSTHFDPVWRNHMWGIWATNELALKAGKPFEIPMMGLGMFAMRKDAWPGFNPLFRGFGGEEGYIHEKVRQHGGKCLCLPGARWLHRFGRPEGVPYKLDVSDRIFNYVVGFRELGMDDAPVIAHFKESVDATTINKVLEQADAVMLKPELSSEDTPHTMPKLSVEAITLSPDDAETEDTLAVRKLAYDENFAPDSMAAQVVELPKSVFEAIYAPLSIELPGEGVNLYTKGAALDAVCRLIASVKPERILEFGTALGATALSLAKCCPYAQVITIDVADRAMVAAGTPQREQIEPRQNVGSAYRGSPEEERIKLVLLDPNRPYDLKRICPEGKVQAVFVDGWHSFAGVIKDTKAAIELIDEDGIIVWDDFSDNETGVVKALKAISAKAVRPLILRVGDSGVCFALLTYANLLRITGKE